MNLCLAYAVKVSYVSGRCLSFSSSVLASLNLALFHRVVLSALSGWEAVCRRRVLGTQRRLLLVSHVVGTSTMYSSRSTTWLRSVIAPSVCWRDLCYAFRLLRTRLAISRGHLDIVTSVVMDCVTWMSLSKNLHPYLVLVLDPKNTRCTIRSRRLN